MGFFGKVRLLVGALVHKPFSPKPEKVDLADHADNRLPESLQQEGARAEAESEIQDTERVADLIAKEKEIRATYPPAPME